MAAHEEARSRWGAGERAEAHMTDQDREHSQCTPAPRHPSCSGCCACGGTVLPLAPAPEPVARPWLDVDPDPLGFHRAEDYLVSGVLLDYGLGVEDTLAELRAFYRTWGEAPLLRAIDHAATMRDLDPRVLAVADRLRADKGVAA